MSKREQQRAETRQKIIEAAIECFSAMGFAGTNFREITQLCGVQRALILYHFDSKENLWREAATEVERRFSEAFSQRYTGQAASDRELLVHITGCFIDALIEVPAYGRIMLREGSSQGPRMEWLARHFVPKSIRRIDLQDEQLSKRTQSTVLRDLLGSAIVASVTMAPLMQRARELATGAPEESLYPMSEASKKELIDRLMLMVMNEVD